MVPDKRSLSLAKCVLLAAVLTVMTGVFTLNTRAQVGISGGVALSSFNYSGDGLIPYIGYDIDLRPHLGYDVQWAQLGKQKPLLAPWLSVDWQYPILSRLTLKTALAFTQKGVSFNQHDYEEITFLVRISYLEVPVLLSFDYIKHPRFSAGISGGLYGALAVDARKKTEAFGTGVKVSKLENARNIVSGLVLGLEFSQKIKEQVIKLSLEAFTDINDALLVPEDQVVLYHEVQKVKNAGMYIKLGYDF